MLLESNPKAQAVIAKAEGGDPAALKKILKRLSRYLDGEKPLPREYALFSARGFRELVQSEAMMTAGATFRASVAKAQDEARIFDEKQKKAEEQEAKNADNEARADAAKRQKAPQSYSKSSALSLRTSLYLGPRLPEALLRKIGRAFSQAFRLRRVRGKRPEPEIGLLEKPLYLHHPLDFSRSGLDLSRDQIVSAAKNGDPEALSKILDQLAGHLVGEVDFRGGFFSHFCSRALWAFTNSEIMELAEDTFETDGKLKIDSCSEDDGDLRSLERGFCRAFRLAKSTGKDVPRHPTLKPFLVEKAQLLMHFGASAVESIQIVCSSTSKISDSYLDEWLRYLKNPKPSWNFKLTGKPSDPRTWVYHVDESGEWSIDDKPSQEEDLDLEEEIEPQQVASLPKVKPPGYYDRLERQCHLAELVDGEITKGADPTTACEIVGRMIVQEIVGLPDAKVFISAKAVERVWRDIHKLLEQSKQSTRRVGVSAPERPEK